jgi:hypothetical protein
LARGEILILVEESLTHFNKRIELASAKRGKLTAVVYREKSSERVSLTEKELKIIGKA